MKSFFAGLLLGLMLSLPLPEAYAGLTTQGITSSEYAIKAAYLYNFALFAEWPQTDAAAPITFCIVGKDPFGTSIAEEFKTRHVYDRPVQFQHITTQDDTGDCHVLFINESSEQRLLKILRQVQGKPILTVGEHKKFIDNGGMIGFIIVDDHVQFEVNQAAVEKVDIKLSARMLQLAYRVIKAGYLP